MTVRREKRKNRDGTDREIWIADICVETPAGESVRDRKSFKARRITEQWEQRRRAELLTGRIAKREEAKPEQALHEFLRDWLATWVPVNNRPATQRGHRAHAKRLMERLEDVRLNELTGEHVDRFKAKMIAEGYAAGTINLDLLTLSRALRTARAWKRTTNTIAIELMPAKRPDEKYLDTHEVAALLRCGDSLTIVALETGLRISELRALQWTDVDLRVPRIVVRHSFDDGEQIGPTKGGTKREIPLSNRARAALAGEQHLRGPWVWCDEKGTHLTRSHASSRVRSSCRRARVRIVSPHVLRHTFASRLVQDGVSLRAVQDLLGHTSVTQTQRYAHLAPATLVDAIDRLNGNLTATHSGEIDAARGNRRF